MKIFQKSTIALGLSLLVSTDARLTRRTSRYLSTVDEDVTEFTLDPRAPSAKGEAPTEEVVTMTSATTKGAKAKGAKAKGAKAKGAKAKGAKAKGAKAKGSKAKGSKARGAPKATDAPAPVATPTSAPAPGPTPKGSTPPPSAAPTEDGGFFPIFDDLFGTPLYAIFPPCFFGNPCPNDKFTCVNEAVCVPVDCIFNRDLLDSIQALVELAGIFGALSDAAAGASGLGEVIGLIDVEELGALRDILTQNMGDFMVFLDDIVPCATDYLGEGGTDELVSFTEGLFYLGAQVAFNVGVTQGTLGAYYVRDLGGDSESGFFLRACEGEPVSASGQEVFVGLALEESTTSLEGEIVFTDSPLPLDSTSTLAVAEDPTIFELTLNNNGVVSEVPTVCRNIRLSGRRQEGAE